MVKPHGKDGRKHVGDDPADYYDDPEYKFERLCLHKRPTYPIVTWYDGKSVQSMVPLIRANPLPVQTNSLRPYLAAYATYPYDPPL